MFQTPLPEEQEVRPLDTDGRGCAQQLDEVGKGPGGGCPPCQSWKEAEMVKSNKELNALRQSPDNSQVELAKGELVIRDLHVTGPPVEAAEDALRQGGSLQGAVTQMLQLGGTVLLHGMNRATVDSVAAEVDRLIGKVASVTAETLPSVLGKYSDELRDLFGSHFNGEKRGSVQDQIQRIFREATEAQRAAVVGALTDEQGPLTVLREELRTRFSVVDSRQDHIARELTTLGERVAAQASLREAQNRTPAKGLHFEDAVAEAVEWAFAPYEDTVLCVGKENGSDGGKAGDVLAVLNPDSTSGQDRRVVFEAKCRQLGVAAALRELDKAMANRDADAGVIVFDSVNHAPTRGRQLRVYPGNRIVAVYDVQDPNGLALEAACHLARSMASVAARMDEGESIDGRVIDGHLRRLMSVLDDAKSIARGVGAARRGLDQVDGAYQKLREEVLGIVADISTEL